LGVLLLEASEQAIRVDFGNGMYYTDIPFLHAIYLHTELISLD